MARNSDDAEMNRFASQYGGMGAYRYKREQRKARQDQGNSWLGDALKTIGGMIAHPIQSLKVADQFYSEKLGRKR